MTNNYISETYDGMPAKKKKKAACIKMLNAKNLSYVIDSIFSEMIIYTTKLWPVY